MGKIFDRILLLALCAAGLYILFITAFGSIALACILSFLCCALLMRRRMRTPGHRMTLQEAQAVLAQWAFAPDDEARADIARLLKLPEDDASLRWLPRHTSASVSVGDVFSACKSAQGQERLVIAAPCYADGRAKVFAKTLTEPAVEIYDTAKLIPLIRRSGLEPPKAHRFHHLRGKLAAVLCALPERRIWWKNALFGLMLLPVYLLTGNGAYLFLAIGALFLAGLGWRARRT